MVPTVKPVMWIAGVLICDVEVLVQARSSDAVMTAPPCVNKHHTVSAPPEPAAIALWLLLGPSPAGATKETVRLVLSTVEGVLELVV